MIPAVVPLLLVGLGIVALGGGLAMLRSYGPGYQIGRLLATTRRVSVDEAVRAARSGERRYVAIEGRIDSEEAFEDAAHRPLVLRRTRLEARLGRHWTRFEESIEVVPFEVRDALAGIAVDTAALDEGLVVITRESRGRVADLGERAPASLPRDAPAVASIDQVSAVEHATVLGWPALDEHGSPVMTRGPGRPLVLSTLESGEALRVLARGERLRPRLAAASLVLGVALVLLGIGLAGLTAAGVVTTLGPSLGPSPVLAAAGPAASPIPTGLGGDTRSSGEGPGLVGAPGLAILAVVLLGLAAVAATLLYVRATGGSQAP